MTTHAAALPPTAPPRGPGAPPRVLAVAGSDPSGGAGVQADLKSIAAADGYGMAALTALTAQNTCGVRDVHVPPPEFLDAQLQALSDDVAIDAVKIGMLATAEVAAVLDAWLRRIPATVPVVLDPVMIATSGDRLLDAAGETAVRGLLSRCDVVTPNLPELAVLLGEPPARDWPAAVDQGARLAARARLHVVVKGGHLPGDRVPDALVGPEGTVREVEGRRVDTPHTHGTGCSLSAGLATRFVREGDWYRALVGTKAWLTAALAGGSDLGVGQGRGPVDHLAAVRTAVRDGGTAPVGGGWQHAGARAGVPG
ncbi:bifunctional hydroxymethylpyrimidine kinase/phosphomethylpyrimidine kinase [Isoptericola sp. AK164]|uniref:bifunctional hydroxymethylpyrimidine kinase/phosphomethylpyrimidine kinase n=1 Tax=Isoptericola sp. AK164 TaxID=3024246 RepID=UPI0024188492|nr:bifunctional hydroxymethylpyrimidine kinase/phosphomethylpyrimidine kinase [Isoptericola sp. AK164]